MNPAKLNEWRVLPRIFIGLYGWLFAEVWIWFMALPEPNVAQAGALATMTGASAAFFNFYVNSGNNRD